MSYSSFFATYRISFILFIGILLSALPMNAQQYYSKATKNETTRKYARQLAGCKLTYIYSNYSGGYGGGGASTTIDLCASGYFRYASESSVYVPNGGGVGGARSNNISGSWQVVTFNNMYFLRGIAQDGTTADYRIYLQNGKLNVGGTLYHIEAGMARCR